MPEVSRISLVVGLGNPGARYARTWHNLGYMVLDRWAADHEVEFKPGRGDYDRLDWGQGAGKVTFLKPTPFMNLSGIPTAHFARYLKLSPENVLVICDDVALPLGTLRLRKNGSSGGHKGLASIIGELGSEEIPRMRLGFWTDKWRGDLADHVLSAIPKALQADLKTVVNLSAEALDCILTLGLDTAMNKYNRNFFATDSSES
jgi:peptidyl-tRNA hydrolase, PTH1 family